MSGDGLPKLKMRFLKTKFLSLTWCRREGGRGFGAGQGLVKLGDVARPGQALDLDLHPLGRSSDSEHTIFKTIMIE